MPLLGKCEFCLTDTEFLFLSQALLPATITTHVIVVNSTHTRAPAIGTTMMIIYISGGTELVPPSCSMLEGVGSMRIYDELDNSGVDLGMADKKYNKLQHDIE